jgi:hypothetical protein
MSLTVQEMIQYIALFIAIFGAFCLLAGTMILLTSALRKDVKRITSQAPGLVQKSVVENTTILVGSTTKLIDSLNKMVLTTAGIGVFLILLGISLLAISVWMLLQFGGMTL